jgi:hypothetical protein
LQDYTISWMGDTLVLQVGSTFVSNNLAGSLRRALAALEITAVIRLTGPADLSQEMVAPAPDSEDVASTIVLVRVEDWLREIAAGADDKTARQELKARLDEFLGLVSVLAMRGRPVWLVICPSGGWIAEKYRFTTLCRTYTNLLAARVRSLAQTTLLLDPLLLSKEEYFDREQDRTNHVPYTATAFELLAESVARQLAPLLSANNSNVVKAVVSSPELANFLLGLHVSVHARVAKPSDSADVGKLLRTAASFSLAGEKPTLPEEDVDELLTTQNCWLITVSDRLSEYGPSGVVVARESDGALVVDTMSLSCTVLGKQVEFALLAALQQVAISRALSSMVFEYRDGGRNQPMLAFLKQVTYAEQGERYVLPVEETQKRIGEAAVAPSAWSLTLKP